MESPEGSTRMDSQDCYFIPTSDISAGIAGIDGLVAFSLYTGSLCDLRGVRMLKWQGFPPE